MGNENKHTVGALGGFLHDLKEGEAELNDLFNIIGENELNYLYKLAKKGEIAEIYFSGDKEKILTLNGAEAKPKKKVKPLRIKRDEIYSVEIEDRSEDSVYNCTYWLPLEFLDEKDESFGQLELYFVLTGFDMEGADPFVEVIFSVLFFTVEVDGKTEDLYEWEGLKYMMENYYEQIWNVIDDCKDRLYEHHGITFDEDGWKKIE